ncbi:TIM-barrel domain-containing protein [Autumnicola edwardsiae]|uniref:Glycoside hydrolase family 31 protein n=1 Tax=Autumnicola edwardsiae TaxID=3075594 RepID=A0ABU3CU74_9FLAO|nr:TIM-barrel domain-containing protein [Zunongwangia sp. F297]MDT0649912.1 glycoside hydrolase family 31 protein [Zunongwangia sp. F297]
MKKIFFLWALGILAGMQPVFSQSASIAEPGVAVFYPAQFDSTATLPSLAIVKDLQKKDSLPGDWTVKPEYLQIEGRNAVRFDFEEGVDLYGTGEVIGDLRRNNTDVTLWNTDNYEYAKFDGKQLYQAHPWILGVRPDGTSFGILADNSWRQEIVLDDDAEIISEGPAFRVVVIEKENPQEVMKTLADLTGTMAMPPLWALGYQQSRYSYYPDTAVEELADEFRKRKIPADVIWMDIDYMDGFRVFTFDEEGFPNPEKLNDYLHSKDFKSVYMIDPGVKQDSTYFVYQQGDAGNHWVLDSLGNEYNGEVWPGQVAFPDYTRPETQKWWASLYIDFMNLGIDGVWNDMNEPAVFDGPGGTMPDNNIHRGGGELPEDIHLRYHNVYGLLMVRSSREGILDVNPEKRPFVLSRANYLGGQRYAATWTGDNSSTWDNLKMSIPMSLNLSLSGQSFNGPDIGGFTKTPTPEVFGHWIALGAYYPFSRNHTSNDTEAQEPWAFGEEIEDVSRTAINRRYRLLPYLYTLFHEASTTGMPIMRPTFFADLTNQELRDEQQSFLLGKNLLIIPQWAEDLKMPKGNWETVSFENEEADPYQATVKLREGAIVPVGPVIQSTEDYSTDRITLLVSPDKAGKASGTLYDDAGEGFGYKDGEFSIIEFTASKVSGKRIKVNVKQTEGNLKKDRQYRIALVKDGKVTYSPWSSKNTFTIKI